MNTTELLRAVIATPEWEWEWLDLLSQMEYVGCRKIAKSLSFERMNLETLQHLSEEARHAFLLKGTAEKLGLGPRSWKQGLFSEIGWAYFSLLDQFVSDLQGSELGHYPAVSWAVEQRVLKLYPEYLEITCEPEVKRVLRQILAQEERHAKQFDPTTLMTETTRTRALDVERMLWDDFCASALQKIESKESNLPRIQASPSYLH